MTDPPDSQHPLAGAHAKLARSLEHVDVFERGVLEYLAEQPVSVNNRDDAQPDGLRRIQWIASASTNPPGALGLIVGDWANNTRGALDYLVYELVRRETGADDPR